MKQRIHQEENTLEKKEKEGSADTAKRGADI